MKDRAARYSRLSRTKSQRSLRDTLILAHVGRTPKGKLRLRKVGVVIAGGKEMDVSNELEENDPRFVFESDFGVRKEAHDIVRKSGRYSKFYDTIVKLVYDSK
jgi:hypothetical protein